MVGQCTAETPFPLLLHPLRAPRLPRGGNGRAPRARVQPARVRPGPSTQRQARLALLACHGWSAAHLRRHGL
eukprot:7511996-Lingulodinium_polyedra.AAC.1